MANQAIGGRTPRGLLNNPDIITGTWCWEGGDIITGHVTTGNTTYETYFGVLDGVIGGEILFSGYGDRNGNGALDAYDVYVGSASLNIFATSPADDGTWFANTSTGAAVGLIGNTLAASAPGVGFWFG